MRIILLVILSIFLSACTKRVEVTKAKGVTRVTKIDTFIGGLHIIPWKVGKNKEKEISMGFLMKIDVPQVSKEDQAKLAEIYPVDSWAYRIIHHSQGRSTEVGLLYLPFARTIKTTDNFSVRLYYHAAAVSNRFRKFSCPAFGHRKKIVDYKVEKTNPQNNLFIHPNGNLRIKNYALDHMPVIFSAGIKLSGTYEVEVALYSHEENRRYSEFISMGNRVVIADENEVKVNSCIGIREETHALPSSHEPTIEDIQIR